MKVTRENGKADLTELVQIRFTPKQIERMEDARKKLHLATRSDFIRQVTMQRVDEVLESQGAKP
jgi:hypothetical protein